jgi:hypothetical protein
MVHLRLPIRVLARPATDDEACGEHLAGIVQDAIGRGSRGAVAVAVREQRLELIELRGVMEAGVAVPMFLAGLTRSSPEGFGPPLAVGLAGRFQFRSGPASAASSPPSPVAVAFLEWPDCRWWQWTVMLDSAGQILPDSDMRRRAVDGDPLPGGLGRWWTLGRRTRSTVRFGSPPSPPVAEPHIIH